MITEIEQLRAIRAQAAVWVTDLHGPERSAALEAGLRRWLAEDERHAQAFELATEAWQRTGNIPTSLSQEAARSPRTAAYAFAGAAALGLLLAAGFYWLKNPALSTGNAEQRIVDLADGTQVTLNANSRLLVNYTKQSREISLARGEALFNVAKLQNRPFVVVAGNRKIIALGTHFEVRREDSNEPVFTVTLIEGRVAVEPLTAPNLLPVESDGTVTLLKPGQRLRFAANKTDALDAPSIDKVTAWQHGQLIFEDTSLRDAAQEFNRYGKRRLKIDAGVPLAIRVGGVFRIGDPDSFARAVANAHQLRIIESAEEIKITAP